MTYYSIHYQSLTRFFCVLLIALHSAVSFSVYAQTVETQRIVSLQQTDSIREFEMDEVIVQGVETQCIVSPQQTLSGDKLKQMNALSVADAIRYFSGVQIKDYGGVGGIKTINVRSMGSMHTGVYYNGVQLGNAQNGQIDLGKFSLENLDEIRLFNGQQTNILQSAREVGSANSVYLTTRRPHFRNHHKVAARASMKAGSFGLANPHIGADILFKDGLSLTMDAEYLYATGKYKFRYYRETPSGEVAYDTTAIRQNGDIQAVRAELGLQHYYSSTGLYKLWAYNYYSERGIPGAIVNNVWRNGERIWDRNTFVQGVWQDEYWNRYHLRALFKYANDYTHYCNNDERLLLVDNEYLQQEAYFSLAQKVNIFHWWQLSLSYDFQYNSLHKYATAHRLTHWLALQTAFQYNTILHAQAAVLMTNISDKTPDESGKNSTYFTPSFNLSYTPYKGLYLSTFYKHSLRYPTFNDLYYVDMGNASLKPEIAKQRDIGIDYHKETKISSSPIHSSGVGDAKFPTSLKPLWAFNLSAHTYYNRIKNKIVAYPKGQQFRWTMLNLGDVQIYGLDASADASLHLPHDIHLSARLQYTYQKAIDITSPTDSYYRHQIPYIPWHSGSAVFNFQWREYGLNYSFIYVGERYNQQENIIYNYVQPWYTHDLSLYASWQIQPVQLKVRLDINNLLGQDYEVIQNYPMPKQNFRCTLSVEY